MERKIQDIKIFRRIHLTRVLAGDVKISFKGGRPKDRGPINREDILNLKILLNTAESFESFLYSC